MGGAGSSGAGLQQRLDPFAALPHPVNGAAELPHGKGQFVVGRGVHDHSVRGTRRFGLVDLVKREST